MPLVVSAMFPALATQADTETSPTLTVRATDTHPSALPRMSMTPEMSPEEQRQRAILQRRAADLEALRILAWCVQRNRYSAEPVRIDGGRRGKARVATFTFYLEAADLSQARDAVREIVRRREA